MMQIAQGKLIILDPRKPDEREAIKTCSLAADLALKSFVILCSLSFLDLHLHKQIKRSINDESKSHGNCRCRHASRRTPRCQSGYPPLARVGKECPRLGDRLRARPRHGRDAAALQPRSGARWSLAPDTALPALQRRPARPDRADTCPDARRQCCADDRRAR